MIKSIKRAKSIIFKYLLSMQFHVLVLYRLSHYFYTRVPLIGKLLAEITRHILRAYSSCDISPIAVIGEGVKFPHPTGIVIGNGVKIGAGALIFQQVTIGSHAKADKGFEYPVLGEAVCIYAKSSIVGNVKIGDYAVIGAHSLVLCDVPKGKTALGVPARILEE